MTSHLPHPPASVTMEISGIPHPACGAIDDVMSTLRQYIRRGSGAGETVRADAGEIGGLRRRALALLNQLRAQQMQLDRALTQSGRPDPFRRVTGASSIEHAIAATMRIIRSIDELVASRERAPHGIEPVMAARPARRSARTPARSGAGA